MDCNSGFRGRRRLSWDKIMKTPEELNALMQRIPEKWRKRWCQAELCACMGCVQTGNKQIMAEAMSGNKYIGDPEYIDESRIDPDVYKTLKITKEEWEVWNNANT